MAELPCKTHERQLPGAYGRGCMFLESGKDDQPKYVQALVSFVVEMYVSSIRVRLKHCRLTIAFVFAAVRTPLSSPKEVSVR